MEAFTTLLHVGTELTFSCPMYTAHTHVHISANRGMPFPSFMTPLAIRAKS